MTDRADTSFTHGTETDGGAWHRPSSGSFEAAGGRPGRPRADLPARTTAAERAPARTLKRRGVKSPDVPVVLKPASAAGSWQRAVPATGRDDARKGRRRSVLATRETLSRAPVAKWIGPLPEGESPFGDVILAIERFIFGDPNVAETSWKRPAAPPEPRDWPLPPARPVGRVVARPAPRRRVIVARRVE